MPLTLRVREGSLSYLPLILILICMRDDQGNDKGGLIINNQPF